MKWSIVLALALIGPICAVNPSSGCGKKNSNTVGALFQHDTVSDGVNSDRSFVEYIPSSYDKDTPMPLMIYFHGQYGNAMSDASSCKYTTVGEEHGFVSLYPQGLGRAKGDEAKAAGANCGTGWNVGAMAHDPNTCDESAYACCYASCKSEGVCSGDGGTAAACGWTTCFSDEDFVKNMLDTVESELCIDLDAIFVTGGSNGGMMTHNMYAVLPDKFRAVMPVFGLPLVGHIDVPEQLVNTSILLLHDRSDTVIPVDGGWADGWQYESADDTLATWAKLHGCESSQTTATTPYDGGNVNLACTEFASCSSGHRVMKCMYDGHHGSWFGTEEELTWWFFSGAMIE